MTGGPVEPGPSAPETQPTAEKAVTETLGEAPTSGFDPVTGRPIGRLPKRELVRLSLYWLGLSSIFSGLNSS